MNGVGRIKTGTVDPYSPPLPNLDLDDIDPPGMCQACEITRHEKLLSHV
jgi:hypothetical protein